MVPTKIITPVIASKPIIVLPFYKVPGYDNRKKMFLPCFHRAAVGYRLFQRISVKVMLFDRRRICTALCRRLTI